MIKKGQVVSIHYKLTNADGEELDRSEPGQPLNYLHGSGQIIPGLEKAVESMKVGEKKIVKLSAKDGYGERNESLKLTVPRSAFPADVKPQPGMQFEANLTDDSPVQLFTIQEVTAKAVVIDGNHPLAGEKLQFDVELAEVRDATDEEKAHGHVHGPGGAHGH